VGLTAPAELWLASLGQPGGGLLLDLDGTLLDSEPVHQGAYRQYFASRGWHVDDAVVREFAGRRAHEVFRSLKGPWTGEDPRALTEAVLGVLGASTVRPRPVPGATRLLAECARVALPVAVVTSARLGWVLAALELLGARPDLPVISAQDYSRGKPDPQPYLLGARRLGLRAGGLVAAEDSPAGIASAIGAGVGHVLGVTTTHRAHVLDAAGASTTAPDLMLLAEAVATLPSPHNG